MNGETVLEQDRPRVIKDVPDANLSELLASLKQMDAWVLSMDRKGAIYTLSVAWRGEKSPAGETNQPAGEHAPEGVKVANLARERNAQF